MPVLASASLMACSPQISAADELQAKVLNLFRVVEEDDEVAFASLSKSVIYKFVAISDKRILDGPRPLRMADVITNDTAIGSNGHKLIGLHTEKGVVKAAYDCSYNRGETCAMQEFVFQNSRLVEVQTIFMELE